MQAISGALNQAGLSGGVAKETFDKSRVRNIESMWGSMVCVA